MESAVSLEEFFSSIEGSARIGHWLETDCLQVAVLGLVDNVRTFYNGENVLLQNFETTYRKRSKTALQCYECQGIRHFAKDCPNGKDGEGKRKTRPVKKTRTNVQNPRELS